MAPACVHMPNGGGNFVVFLNLLEVDLDGPMLVLTYPYYASRAARGGGGSFKNIKPIGNIRCCESQMSDQKH